MKVFSNGSEVSSSQIAGTGMSIRLLSNGNVFAEYFTVVTGDVTGNGRIEPTDYIRIRSHLLGTNLLSGLFLIAGDIDANERLEPTDYIRMRAHLLGRESIRP